MNNQRKNAISKKSNKTWHNHFGFEKFIKYWTKIQKKKRFSWIPYLWLCLRQHIRLRSKVGFFVYGCKRHRISKYEDHWNIIIVRKLVQIWYQLDCLSLSLGLVYFDSLRILISCSIASMSSELTEAMSNIFKATTSPEFFLILIAIQCKTFHKSLQSKDLSKEDNEFYPL